MHCSNDARGDYHLYYHHDNGSGCFDDDNDACGNSNAWRRVDA